MIQHKGIHIPTFDTPTHIYSNDRWGEYTAAKEVKDK